MRLSIILVAVALVGGRAFGDSTPTAADAMQARAAEVSKAQQAYNQSVDAANKDFSTQIDHMIKDAVKAGHPDQADALRKEREQVLTPAPAATPAVAAAPAASPVTASATPIVVQTARYGREPTWMDATTRIASGIHGNQLKIAANLAGFLGQDPIAGNKFLEMSVLINGTPVQMRFYDSAFENPTITVAPAANH